MSTDQKPEISVKTLWFTPYAWGKIQWFMDALGKDEFSGFGVSSKDYNLLVEDFHTIKQEVGGATTEMNDKALADYMGTMAKKGIPPRRCMRIWIHSHPFASTEPIPSPADSDTFMEKLGGDTNWNIMMILGKGPPLIRLKVDVPVLGGYAIYPLDYKVDYMDEIWDTHGKKWAAEKKANITKKVYKKVVTPHMGGQHKHKHKHKQVSAIVSGDRRRFEDTDTILLAWVREWNLNYRCTLDQGEWITARSIGFTVDECVKWEDFVLDYTPAELRALDWQNDPECGGYDPEVQAIIKQVAEENRRKLDGKGKKKNKGSKKDRRS